ncbi:hypothetical protein J6590_031545 [Homalodisca vitripennis]|nr:hypothetical protein J6590_031545 [Homalodisca vitripennis]
MVLKRDGVTCEVPVHCQVGQYRCNTGECIHVSLQCNHRADCPHGDDEVDCKEIVLSCARGMFSCHNGEKCVEHHNRCDGIWHCQDGSDERSCSHMGCKAGEFQCKSGPCIPMSWRCDDSKDCEDSSDEEQCEKTTCHPEQEFRCTSGTCIPSTWECDNQPDCTDASDEHESCLRASSCAPDQLVCNNGHCVDHQLVCDGEDDCEDGTDETGCSRSPAEELDVAVHITDTSQQRGRMQCDDNQFTCDKCLPASARCNGTKECSRGEDEMGCSGCMEHQFQCVDSGRCIMREWVCDGDSDCGDKSDEDPAMCQYYEKGVEKAVNHNNSECLDFTCKNMKCLPFSKVCDGTPDCEDRSDEGGRCGGGCLPSSCMDTCQETPLGPRCACYPGYQLSGDSRTCQDVDECALGIFCSQYCHNTPGSFTCSCRYPDFQLQDNRMTCKAKGSEMQIVYVIDKQIRYVTNSHSSLGVMYESPFLNFQVSGLDVDARKKCIYWSSDLTGNISRTCLNTKNTTDTISKLVRPGKLALDWVTRNLYFVERNYILKACNFELQRCAIIATFPPGETISSLAVDPIRRLMFWSTSTSYGETKSMIKRADLSGSQMTVVLEPILQHIADLALDSLHEMIYWLNTERREVLRMTYLGMNKQTIFASPDIPTKLGLFEHSVYWMVEGRTTTRRQHLGTYGNVWQCAVSGPSAWRCDVLKIHPRNTLSAPATFTIMQESLQERGTSECVGQCSHLCVHAQSGIVCLCADGTKVPPGQLCEDSSMLTHPNFSTKVVQNSDGSSFIWTVFKVLMITFVFLPIVIVIIFLLRNDILSYFHSCISVTRKPVLPNIHFNNPAYGVAPSHVETVFHHSRLNPGEHQYENPITADNVCSLQIHYLTKFESFSYLIYLFWSIIPWTDIKMRF